MHSIGTSLFIAQAHLINHSLLLVCQLPMAQSAQSDKAQAHDGDPMQAEAGCPEVEQFGLLATEAVLRGGHLAAPRLFTGLDNAHGRKWLPLSARHKSLLSFLLPERPTTAQVEVVTHVFRQLAARCAQATQDCIAELEVTTVEAATDDDDDGADPMAVLGLGSSIAGEKPTKMPRRAEREKRKQLGVQLPHCASVRYCQGGVELFANFLLDYNRKGPARAPHLELKMENLSTLAALISACCATGLSHEVLPTLPLARPLRQAQWEPAGAQHKRRYWDKQRKTWVEYERTSASGQKPRFRKTVLRLDQDKMRPAALRVPEHTETPHSAFGEAGIETMGIF